MEEKFANYEGPAFLKKKKQVPTASAPLALQGERLFSNAKGQEMISAFRLRKSGNSTILTIPEEVLNLLEVRVGDYLEFVFLPEEKIVTLQPAAQEAKKKKV